MPNHGLNNGHFCHNDKLYFRLLCDSPTENHLVMRSCKVSNLDSLKQEKQR